MGSDDGVSYTMKNSKVICMEIIQHSLSVLLKLISVLSFSGDTQGLTRIELLLIVLSGTPWDKLLKEPLKSICTPLSLRKKGDSDFWDGRI